MTEPTKEQLNTIYIISKGRPQCRTARTLAKMDYPGEWFIVCGNNDDTLEEYRKAWGGHVLIFDWYEEVKHTDTLDNFGFETKASGACPVRNATMKISKGRGELRHWQFDDDYNDFHRINETFSKMRRFNSGREFEDWLFNLAKLGYAARMRNVGFPPGSETFVDNCFTFSGRVFNAHNLPSTDDLFIPWVGRMNDDLINAINCWRIGGYEMSIRAMNMTMPSTQSEGGGLSEMYIADGTVRKSAYPVLIAPGATKLIKKFGRYHHHVDWSKLRPKLLHEKWRKKETPLNGAF